mmetsp:Transcript_29519/g.68406  ORF Transcript_29519/g.68406 Transcript_29519/m.68406 type:complete len:237 (-) Transcript_29519:2530-3240(-)
MGSRACGPAATVHDAPASTSICTQCSPCPSLPPPESTPLAAKCSAVSPSLVVLSRVAPAWRRRRTHSPPVPAPPRAAAARHATASTGVPSSSTASTQAPAASKDLAAAASPDATEASRSEEARLTGDRPVSAKTLAASEEGRATSRGSLPSLFLTVLSPPSSNSTSNISWSPVTAARCRHESPCVVTASAPPAVRTAKYTMSFKFPDTTAQCSGSMPTRPIGRAVSAPALTKAATT